jgi:hypothetical protein
MACGNSVFLPRNAKNEETRVEYCHSCDCGSLCSKYSIVYKLTKKSFVSRHWSTTENLDRVQEAIEGQDLNKQIAFGRRLAGDYVTGVVQDGVKVLSFVHLHSTFVMPSELGRLRKMGGMRRNISIHEEGRDAHPKLRILDTLVFGNP